jgi:hypothetical protein
MEVKCDIRINKAHIVYREMAVRALTMNASAADVVLA